MLLCGGRDAGVMEAVAAGAHDAGGLVVGILPGDTAHGVADGVDIAIPTGMGDARNAINVLASHVVVALPWRTREPYPRSRSHSRPGGR